MATGIYVVGEDAPERAVVDGVTDAKDRVVIGFEPPRARRLEPDIADQLVGPIRRPHCHGEPVSAELMMAKALRPPGKIET